MKILPGDLAAVMENDPAINSEDEAIKYHMGLHVVAMYREAHELWLQGRTEEAMKINYEAHSLTGADVHPGATIGENFFIDHATGIVIGETTIIGNNVMIYQGVTLGGVSTSKGKRHPTLGDNVVIGANASVLGNITIGNNVRIGAGSVVVKDVPDDCTVVGIPGKIVKMKGVSTHKLEHNDLPDPIKEKFLAMEKEIAELKEMVKKLSEQ
ncbi:MAG: serine O-acetyltransferase [Candidatus Methanomethylophilaceae archaeon]|nr:serine O-acetyltransferase [Thermoplasmata archaeon]MBQ2762300.1 serine O-acetyltransferase [Candidatus Methanomethylophilaceae archaeon]